MKKTILYALLLGICIPAIPATAQRNCGQQQFYQHLEEQHPGTIRQLKGIRDAAIRRAEQFGTDRGILMKTTETPLIPVIFHIILDSAQLKRAGGVAGIEDRITTQMKVLNADFNARNSDSEKIPAIWKSLYANVGLRFGLARYTPAGTATNGYEIRIAQPGSFFGNSTAACPDAKYYATGGLDSWDTKKYLNIWIVNPGILLGVTAPPGIPSYPPSEVGVVLNYLAFGSRTSTGQAFYNRDIDKGRTLTHEMGHFFHLWHTWGDDDGLCPGDTGGDDDGISDTPPQADATYNNPPFPQYDACSPAGSSNGIMFMNYMDYTNDAAMYMFTRKQVDVVQGEIALGGNSWSLIQNPHLAEEPELPGNDSMGNVIQIRPNPSHSGIFYIRYDPGKNELKRLVVYNSIGQVVLTQEELNITSINLSAFSKGIYIIRCWFDRQVVTEKIVFE